MPKIPENTDSKYRYSVFLKPVFSDIIIDIIDIIFQYFQYFWQDFVCENFGEIVGDVVEKIPIFYDIF